MRTLDILRTSQRIMLINVIEKFHANVADKNDGFNGKSAI